MVVNNVYGKMRNDKMVICQYIKNNLDIQIK